jgi:hypothetical protein
MNSQETESLITRSKREGTFACGLEGPCIGESLDCYTRRARFAKNKERLCSLTS